MIRVEMKDMYSVLSRVLRDNSTIIISHSKFSNIESSYHIKFIYTKKLCELIAVKKNHSSHTK